MIISTIFGLASLKTSSCVWNKQKQNKTITISLLYDNQGDLRLHTLCYTFKFLLFAVN